MRPFGVVDVDEAVWINQSWNENEFSSHLGLKSVWVLYLIIINIYILYSFVTLTFGNFTELKLNQPQLGGAKFEFLWTEFIQKNTSFFGALLNTCRIFLLIKFCPASKPCSRRMRKPFSSFKIESQPQERFSRIWKSLNKRIPHKRKPRGCRSGDKFSLNQKKWES